MWLTTNLRPKSDNIPYAVLTHWQDKQAYKNWVFSDDFIMAHQNPTTKEAFLEGGGLEQFEVIISTDS